MMHCRNKLRTVWIGIPMHEDTEQRSKQIRMKPEIDIVHHQDSSLRQHANNGRHQPEKPVRSS